MTTTNDDLENRKNSLGVSFSEKQGMNQIGFSDPNRRYPKQEYANQSGVNKASRGEKVNNLKVRTGIPKIGLGHTDVDNYDYSQVQIDESPSGHIIEINDTPAGERILIMHNCGAGVDIQPDGTIVVNSTGNRVEVTSGNYKLAVEGDGNLFYTGNLNMTVTGDYTLDVKGTYHVKVGGNKIMKVVGSYRKTIMKHMTEVIQMTKASTVLKQSTNTLLGDVTNTIKGTFKNLIKGKGEYFHSDVAKFTSESGIDLASPNINIAADNMSCIGTTGTIGGEDMIGFARNIYVGKNIETETMVASNDIKAATVHANLDGLASNSELAGWSSSSGRAPAAAPSGASSVSTSFERDTKTTGLPTAEYIEEHLRQSNLGYRKVKIDEDDGIKDSVDQTTNNSGVSDRDLNIEELRSKMKNTNNFDNSKFILNQTSKEILSPKYSSKAPPNIGRLRGSEYTTTTGAKSIGSNKSAASTKRFVPSQASSKSRRVTYLPDPQYDINKLDDVTMSTKLTDKISVSKFVAAVGDAETLVHIDSAEKRKQIARNLLIHVSILELFQSLDDFAGFSLTVAEGIYRPGPSEVIDADSIADLKRTGRTIVYELYDSKTGEIDLEKTFDLAVYLKDNAHYDRLSLFYDTFDANKSIHHAQIIIATPELGEEYAVTFDMKINTIFNKDIMSQNDLVEIPGPEDEPEESYDIDDAAPDDISGSFASEAAPEAAPEAEAAPEPEPEPEPLTQEERKQIQEDQYLARPYPSKEVAEGGIKRVLIGRLFPNRTYRVIPDGENWKIIRIT